MKKKMKMKKRISVKCEKRTKEKQTRNIQGKFIKNMRINIQVIIKKTAKKNDTGKKKKLKEKTKIQNLTQKIPR